MYEVYELLLEFVVPKRVLRAFETLAVARVLPLIWTCTLAYYSALFFWHSCQLLARFHVAESRHSSISTFWQLAVVALLTMHMHLRLVMAG